MSEYLWGGWLGTIHAWCPVHDWNYMRSCRALRQQLTGVCRRLLGWLCVPVRLWKRTALLRQPVRQHLSAAALCYHARLWQQHDLHSWALCSIVSHHDCSNVPGTQAQSSRQRRTTWRQWQPLFETASGHHGSRGVWQVLSD